MSNGNVTRIDPASHEPPSSGARLVGVDDPVQGRQFQLPQATVSIGRFDDNTVVLDSEHVSRHHARISWHDRHYVIEDLASSNGVVINGRPLHPNTPQDLSHGDSLQLGDCMFVFVDTTAQESPQLMSTIQIDRNRVRQEVDELLHQAD